MLSCKVCVPTHCVQRRLFLKLKLCLLSQRSMIICFYNLLVPFACSPFNLCKNSTLLFCCEQLLLRVQTLLHGHKCVADDQVCMTNSCSSVSSFGFFMWIHFFRYLIQFITTSYQIFHWKVCVHPLSFPVLLLHSRVLRPSQLIYSSAFQLGTLVQ